MNQDNPIAASLRGSCEASCFLSRRRFVSHPLLRDLDHLLDRRLVRTLLDLVLIILIHRHYLSNDHLGSTSLTMDSNGTKIDEIRYKPCGEIRYTWGVSPTNIGYTGQRLDATSLMFYQARYYSPSLDEWHQAHSRTTRPRLYSLFLASEDVHLTPSHIPIARVRGNDALILLARCTPLPPPPSRAYEATGAQPGGTT